MFSTSPSPAARDHRRDERLTALRGAPRDAENAVHVLCPFAALLATCSPYFSIVGRRRSAAGARNLQLHSPQSPGKHAHAA